jgi:hypothetical protein
LSTTAILMRQVDFVCREADNVSLFVVVAMVSIAVARLQSVRRSSSGSLAMFTVIRRDLAPRLILTIDKGQCLPVGVAHDEARSGLLDGSRPWEAARLLYQD